MRVRRETPKTPISAEIIGKTQQDFVMMAEELAKEKTKAEEGNSPSYLHYIEVLQKQAELLAGQLSLQGSAAGHALKQLQRGVKLTPEQQAKNLQ